MTSTAPEGWYTDPADPSRHRYWFGDRWSEDSFPSTPPSAQTSAEPAVDGDLERERESWLTFARREYDEMVARYDSTQAERHAELQHLEQQVIDTSDLIQLQEVGLDTTAGHPVATSIEHKEHLDIAVERRRELARRKDAVLGATNWTVNGSLTEGRKMVEEFSKLMLRAYNSELDAIVRSVNATNGEKKAETLSKKRDQIKRLGKSMNIEINPQYHELAAYEVKITSLYQAAKQVEKELERERKAQLREQKQVEAELAREQAKLDKEASLHQTALEALRNNPSASAEEIADLEAKILEVESAQADITRRAANTRAGHVYVISNNGSFGEGVVKIGMTRRLDPMDRVNELGDASVPFKFSVHALIFSDDAVELETQLHRRFEAQRVNRINRRREFFRVSPAAVREALVELNASLLEFDEEVMDEEWAASQ